VWESGQPIVVENYAEWERRDLTLPPGFIGSAACAPVLSNGSPAGALLISHPAPAGRISTDTVEMLSRLAQIASVAYDNARLFAAARANEHELELRVEQRTRELRQALNDNGRLRELAVQAAAQSERARLARELHDSVSQALYGIALGARTIQESGAVKLAPQLSGPLEYILQLTEAGLTEMRALIFELRPEALLEEGLHAALKKQTDAIRLRFRIKVTAQLCSEPECDFAVKEALYRIALEAIHNAVKHARATEIVLVMSENDGGVMVEVRDNGKGFDPSAAYPGHLGLKSMRERAQALKGHLAIDSAPEQGTTVRARLPGRPDERSNSLGATLEMFGA
jgi:signal transduction histidine kinase